MGSSWCHVQTLMHDPEICRIFNGIYSEKIETVLILLQKPSGRFRNLKQNLSGLKNPVRTLTYEFYKNDFELLG